MSDPVQILRRALVLAEHDQIDLLNLSRTIQELTEDPKLKDIRTIRADRIQDRLNMTQDALRRIPE